MTKSSALDIKRKLNNLECYKESNLSELLAFYDPIVEVIKFIENAKPKDAASLQLSSGQLFESKRYLESWIDHPRRGTMRSTFREYKKDFLSVLQDFIGYGDKFNLWEDT